MVDFGKLAKKAKSVAEAQGDKISSAVNKSTDYVDKKTKGKYTDKLDKIDDAAKKLDKGAPDAADATEPAAGGVVAENPAPSAEPVDATAKAESTNEIEATSENEAGSPGQ